MRATPLDEPGNVGGQRVGVSPEEEVDMIGLDRQSDDLPFMLSRDLPDDLRQPIPHRPHEHLPAPLGTPDDVVHDEMNAVLLVFILHVAMIPQSNMDRKPGGPFIPCLKARGFLALFCCKTEYCGCSVRTRKSVPGPTRG